MANSESWIPNTGWIIAVIAAISALIVAVISPYLSYRWTRKMQLEAEWRKDKLKHYSHLFDLLTEKMSLPRDFNRVDKDWIRACNIVTLVAPQEVTDILFEFRLAEEDAFEQEMDREAEDSYVSAQKQRLRRLVLAVRKDLQVGKSDNPETFRYKLRSPLSED